MLIGIDASRANKTKKTGTEWYSYYLINELKKLDNRNHYFLYSREPLRGDLAWLPANFQSRVLAWPPKFLWTQARLAWEMFRRPPELLFVPAHTLPLIRPKKTVTTCHDIGFEYYPELYSPLELRYHRWAMRLAVRRATKIIVPSHFTKNEMIKFYGADPAKFEVVYHGYNRERYRVIEDQSAISQVLNKYQIKKPYLLFIGRLEKKKNTAGLVEAFARILNSPEGKRRFRDLGLVLVGEPGYGFEEVLLKIKKYELEEKVILPGWVSEEELPYLLNGAELFVLPSFYEGFGLPILEALASGTPVAASRLASIPEVGGEAIEYFDPHRVADLVDKIGKVLLDHSRRLELRRRGLERAKEFSWEKCAKETLEVLESII